MPDRAPLLRVLLWIGLPCCGALAVTGGLALRGPELVAVGVAGTLAGCMAAGIAREAQGGHARSTPEVAAAAAGATVVALLVLAGIAALAGGGAAALAVVVGVLGFLLVRAAAGRRRAVPEPAPASGQAPTLVVHRPSVDRPVTVLSTPELGQEWLRTTDVLATRLHPTARHAIVARREETLDELERRDRDGFDRWLAGGSVGDPAEFVRGGPSPAGHCRVIRQPTPTPPERSPPGTRGHLRSPRPPGGRLDVVGAVRCRVGEGATSGSGARRTTQPPGRP